MKIRSVGGAFIAALIAVSAAPAWAIPIDPNVTISGSVAIDTANLLAPTGGASQSGSVSSIVGGVTTTTSFNGTAIGPIHPLAGTLTETGNGFGMDFNISGSGANGNSEINGLFGDMSFVIANTSATETFTVKLRVDFRNSANGDGTDAFADMDMRFEDANTLAELFFSDLTSDTVNGDQKNGVALATSGDALSDIGVNVLTLVLLPGTTRNLGGSGPELAMDGGAFGPDSFFSAVGFMRITVDSVTGEQVPEVPLPGTWLLLSLGLAALGLTSRRSCSFE